MALTDEELVAIFADLNAPSENAGFPVLPPARRATKRAEGRTGRSAFVAPICEAHPDWEHEDGTFVVATEDSHCAKFAHLPGANGRPGRGFYQPPFYRGIVSVFLEMGKPIALIGLLLGAFFVLKVTVLSGGFLRSGNELCKPTSGVSNSVGNTTTNVDHSRNVVSPSVTPSAVRGVHRDRNVKCS